MCVRIHLSEKAILDAREKRKSAFAGLVGGLVVLYEWALVSNLSLAPSPGQIVLVMGLVLTVLASVDVIYSQWTLKRAR
jgi:hypothetical protein